MFYTFGSKIKRGPNDSRDLVVEDEWGFDWLLFINYKKENKTRITTETKSVLFNTLFALYGYEKSEKFSNRTTVLKRQISTYFFPLFFIKAPI